MIARLSRLAAVSALCLAWVPAPGDPLAQEPDAGAVARGPAVAESDLAPYFTSPALQSALDIRIVDGRISFRLPRVTLLARKEA